MYFETEMDTWFFYLAHNKQLIKFCSTKKMLHHHIQLIKEKGNLSQLEGDHEKSTEEEKINGEVVAAETWNEMKCLSYDKWIFSSSSSIFLYHVFVLYLLLYHYGVHNALEKYGNPFFFCGRGLGVCENPSFCFLLLWGCGY